MKKIVTILLITIVSSTGTRILCPKNEVWQNGGFDCQRCSNYKVVRCAALNETKCYCAPGYVRHDVSNLCVPTESCPGIPCEPSPPPCPANSTFQESGYDCQTCGLLTIKCALERMPKCYCNPGYARNYKGECVRLEDCPQPLPPPCPANSTFQESGYDCQTCRHLTVKCALKRTPKCYCNPGYARNNKGECVRHEDCPPSIRCGQNEVPTDCKSPCLPSCDKPNPGICNFLVCNKGCICAPGYIREPKSGACIKEEICPKNCAKKGAVFSTCASNCPKTCHSREDIVCPAVCVYGCVCKNNLIFDETTNKCVRECPCSHAVPKANTSYVEYITG